MSLPVLSIVAFAIAIIISCVSQINVGFLSIAFAFIIGVFFGGMKVADVAAGFPTNLFLILVGVTLLFSQASVNGTLDKVAKQSVKLARGNVGVIPVLFFFLAAGLATIGAGNIATTALLAPVAMTVAGNLGISGFLMTVAVCCGANSGALSPFAPTGVIANGLLARIGITGQAWPTFFNNFIAEGFVGLSGYFLLGGYKLFSRTASRKAVHKDERWNGSLHDDSGPLLDANLSDWCHGFCHGPHFGLQQFFRRCLAGVSSHDPGFDPEDWRWRPDGHRVFSECGRPSRRRIAFIHAWGAVHRKCCGL